MFDNPSFVADRYLLIYLLVKVQDVGREAADPYVVSGGFDHHVDHHVLRQGGVVIEAGPAGVGCGGSAQQVFRRIVGFGVKAAYAQIVIS